MLRDNTIDQMKRVWASAISIDLFGSRFDEAIVAVQERLQYNICNNPATKNTGCCKMGGGWCYGISSLNQVFHAYANYLKENPNIANYYLAKAKNQTEQAQALEQIVSSISGYPIGQVQAMFYEAYWGHVDGSVNGVLLRPNEIVYEMIKDSYNDDAIDKKFERALIELQNNAKKIFDEAVDVWTIIKWSAIGIVGVLLYVLATSGKEIGKGVSSGVKKRIGG